MAALQSRHYSDRLSDSSAHIAAGWVALRRDAADASTAADSARWFYRAAVLDGPDTQHSRHRESCAQPAHSLAVVCGFACGLRNCRLSIVVSQQEKIRTWQRLPLALPFGYGSFGNEGRKSMNWAGLILAVSLVTTACGTRNPADVQVVPPNGIADFSFLYSRNCSGCHAMRMERGGVAIGLGDPLYLAIADDATIRRVTSDGVAGTSMPARSRNAPGGMLTGVIGDRRHRGRHSSPLGEAGRLARRECASPMRPRVLAIRSAERESTALIVRSCHGADGHGGKQASSIVDGSYLALVSDQNLRTTVIAGRREWGAPDWRGDVPGQPMSTPEDVTDVVAWIGAQRTQFPGQPYSGAEQAKGGIR